jgi:hypothetical protein
MKEKTWLDLALLPLNLSRRLLAMAATATKKRTAEMSEDELRQEIRRGSSYCAFALAARTRPLSVEEMMREMGDIPVNRQEEIFDAVADGFHVFDDARCRSLL